MFGFGKKKKTDRKTVEQVMGVRLDEVITDLSGLRETNLEEAKARVADIDSEIAAHEAKMAELQKQHDAELERLNAARDVAQGEVDAAERWLTILDGLPNQQDTTDSEPVPEQPA